MKLHALFLTALLFAPSVSFAAEPAPAAPSGSSQTQYAYMPRLVPRLHDDKAWTSADSELVGKHFERLKRLNNQGKVIFAGRSMTDGASTFGIVVLDKMSESDARAIMLADDAVAGNIMTAELVPFTAVFERVRP